MIFNISKYGGNMKLENMHKVELVRLCGFFFTVYILLFLFSGCIEMVEQKQHWQPVKVRIPCYPEVEVVYTNQEHVSVRVRKGNCLSRVIERAISRYIRKKGCKETYNFSETLCSIIKTISTNSLKSRDINLIYPGEVIRFRLPYKIVLTKVSDYYLPVKRIYGIGRLKAIIDFKWLVDYKENYFDCSERSAFVEYLLENEGFNTDIVGNETHCWVIVEAEAGKFVHIETVASPSYFIDNKQYLYRYRSIYEAMQSNSDEYDWWNVAKVNKYFISNRISSW